MGETWESEILVSNYNGGLGLEFSGRQDSILVLRGIHFFTSPPWSDKGCWGWGFPTTSNFYTRKMIIQVSVFGHGYVNEEQKVGVAESAIIQKIILPVYTSPRDLQRFRRQYPFAEVQREVRSEYL